MKNFSEHTKAVFAAMETTYDEMNNLMQDVALGREIYDAESDRKISKAEANAKILDFSRKVLGIEDIKNATEVRRAIRDNGRQWFDIIEDTVNVAVAVGLQENDWFNELVDRKTIGYHDRQDFYVENEAILSVAKAGTSHHDHVLQRLGVGQPISIPTELHVVKVGADINKYIAGQVDWSKLIDAITTAYIADIQKDVYSQVAVAVNQLPATFKGTGALNKANFDNIIENVSLANNGAEVILMATRAGVNAINGIQTVQYIADFQKDNHANSGSIGIYEGNRIVVIPNRFTDNTMTSKIFADQIMMIPVIGDAGKFIKYVEEGDIMISEIMDRDSKYTSDLQTYEVQRRYGTGVVLGRKFGAWTL